jgi:hypothetical protein
MPYQEAHLMTQHETLFDSGSTAWRLELRIKAGGGPFDPAGYSIQLVDHRGRLVINMVASYDSSPWPLDQLMVLLDHANARMGDALDKDHKAELKLRLAATPPKR